MGRLKANRHNGVAPAVDYGELICCCCPLGFEEENDVWQGSFCWLIAYHVPCATHSAPVLLLVRDDSDSDWDDEDFEDISMGSSSEHEEEAQPIPSTEIMVLIWNEQTQSNEIFRVLLDSGTSRCMGTEAAVRRAGLYVVQDRTHWYKTAAGTFTTTKCARIRAHRLLELNSRRKLQRTKVQVINGELGVYDFIFGRDYMNRYGIDLLFSEQAIRWDGFTMKMREPTEWTQERTQEALRQAHFIPNEDGTGQLVERDEGQCRVEDGDDDEFGCYEELLEEHLAQQIMDSKYEKQDLLRVAKDQTHLSEEQRDQLHTLLEQYETLFEGGLGAWPDDEGEVSIELRADAQPYHCGKPIRVPHFHLETLRKEVNHLVEIGVKGRGLLMKRGVHADGHEER